MENGEKINNGHKVIEYLLNRKGFDDWWNTISDFNKKNIIDSINDITEPFITEFTRINKNEKTK